MNDTEMNDIAAVELYRRFRPRNLSQLVGQEKAVAVLTEMIERKRVPHALLLTGGSGTGKTTIARILRRELNCSKNDFIPKNAADSRGIDTIREINSAKGLSPVGGDCRIWLMDECHQLTTAAQSVFLEMLEDTPEWVYFFLATTDPQKLLPTIRTRCTEVALKSLSAADIRLLLKGVCEKEKVKLSEEVADRIAEVAEGSARKALVLLHSVIGLSSEDEQLAAILSNDAKREAFDLVKALLWEKASWLDVAKILKTIEDGNDLERLRHLVLVNVSNTLLKGGKQSERAFAVIKAFECDWFASKKAGLVAACYDVMGGK